MIPSFGETCKEIYQGWIEASKGNYLVKGILVGDGIILSSRQDGIYREFRYNKNTVSTCRKINKEEEILLHESIECGTFQVEERQPTGLGLYRKSTDGQHIRTLHQARGQRIAGKCLDCDEVFDYSTSNSYALCSHCLHKETYSA